ncbi:WD40-repeat-containing domain protein [Hygrophoropsis aurantiaca]|uniref:WD40-repeat-containing domain protein n=1 Tax=Hygrophoropsis aurantiaca TaxID=72124 RepID=A0ACB7ZXS0_9AGAM|nr:WD40-repeat-containing domain protein [Hygrophoropsis aurantiaca]
MFFDPISQSALHVYRTALPFIPSSTRLCQLVQAESDLSSEGGISVRFGLEDKWDACTRTISVKDPLTSVAFSPDGKLIASASEEIGVQLWNAATGTNVANVGPGPSDKTSCPVKFSLSGAYVGVGSKTGLVTIWDALTAQIVVSDRHHHSKSVTSLVFSADGELAASASKDGRIQLWAVKTGDPRHQLQHTEAVQSVAFSSDNKMLISGSNDHTIGVWDVVSGDMLRTLKGHSDAITCVAFSDDNQFIASGSEDRSVRIWDVSTGKCVRTHLKIDKEDVKVVRFTPNGKHVISICDDVVGFAKVSSSLLGGNSFQSIWTSFKFYAKAVSRTLLVTTKAAPFVHSRFLEYSIATEGYLDPPIHFGFSGEGKMTAPVFAFSVGSLVFVTSALAPVSSLLPAFHSFSHECTAIAISSNGDRVASGNKEGTIQIWDPTLSLKNWGELSDNLKAAATSFITSADGRFFLVKSLFELQLKDEYGTTIRALDVGDVDMQRDNEIDALFAPDSNTFAYWAEEGMTSMVSPNSYSLRIHSSATGRRIVRFAKLDRIWCVALVTADDGQNLVAIAHGSVIGIWDVGSGKSVCTLRPEIKVDEAGTDDDNDGGTEASADADGHWPNFFTGLAFSDKGASIVCGTSTGEAYLFDVQTSELRAEIEGREPRITHIAIPPIASSSQQNQRIALGYADGSIDLWSPSRSTKAHSNDAGRARNQGVSEVETGVEPWQPTHELTSDDCFPFDIELLVFTADGTRLVCRSSDGSVSVWAVPPIREGDPCALCEGARRVVESTSADDVNAGTSNNARVNPHLISASWGSNSAQNSPLQHEIYYDCLFRSGYVVLSDGWVMYSQGLGAESRSTRNQHEIQKRVLWLPAALRPSGPMAFAAYGGKLVIMTVSHRVVFLELRGNGGRVG